MAPKSDSNTHDRASRLVELRKEAALAFNCSDPMTTAERHIVEAWSVLKLGLEVVSARLVGGANIDVVELIRLNEALAAYVPPRKQYETNRLEVVFVDSEGKKADLRSENEMLRKAIDTLKSELRKARGEPDPEPVLAIPDNAISAPQRQLPAPSKDDEKVMGWTNALGGGAVPWTAAGGYSRALGE